MSKKIENAIRKLALSLPETTEDFPWGHSAFKVKSKSFIFMVAESKKIKLSLKLPESGPDALTLPMTEPTAYNLGKSGWVTFYLDADNKVPIAAIESWVMESYMAIAPKKLVESIGTSATKKKSRVSKTSNAKKAKSTAKKSITKKKGVKKKVSKKKTTSKSKKKSS